MKNYLTVFIILISLSNGLPQVHSDTLVSKAFQNAEKGIIWMLSNIPENKTRFGHDLISDDRLISTVRLDVEINGVKIESSGFENTTEVNIRIYRSVESLTKDGYLKNKKLKLPGEE